MGGGTNIGRYGGKLYLVTRSGGTMDALALVSTAEQIDESTAFYVSAVFYHFAVTFRYVKRAAKGPRSIVGMIGSRQ